MVDMSRNGHGKARLRGCWLLSALWLFTFFWSVIASGSPTGLVLNGVQMLILVIIMIVHASLLYGWLGVTLFCGVSILVGLLLEASSVANGFPFGSFVHNSGPQIWGVPLQAMLIYMCYGWYAWALARIICLNDPTRLSGMARCATPIIAAFVLAGFDFPIDPILSTVFGLWTFQYPGGQFGVPITNFVGWGLTGAIIFSIMSIVDRRFRAAPAAHTQSYWLLPCCIWVALAAQYPILWMRAPPGLVDLGARTFVISDIFEASFATSLFSILFVGLLALTRLYQYRPAPS